MKKITISTPSKNYSVYIGSGIIKELNAVLNDRNHLSKILIITDEKVKDLHLPALLERLENYDVCTFITPTGENAKTFEIYYKAITYALEQKLDRNSVLLAFGGGAIGDLGGFIASTYMRGIPFIQIPTTILAHDSAVGGKVAINHPVGKNMIGSFYQPEAVIYDLAFLQTLSLQEKRSGFAELIKHALISDNSFFEDLIHNIKSLDNLSVDKLQPILSKGIKVKANIVAIDEKEMGPRAFLNFGHTLGHAIEAEYGYGEMTHGEAVVIGMIFALKLSIDLLNLSFDLKSFTIWLQKLGYETRIPSEISNEKLVMRMKQDKKALNQDIRMVLLDDVGHPVLQTISEDVISEYLINM